MYKEFRRDFIFYTQVPNHKVIKEYLYQKIIDQGQIGETWEDCDVATNYYSPGSNDFLKEQYILESIAYKPLDEMANETEEISPKSIPDPNGSFVEDIWYSIYNKRGQFQAIHNHAPYSEELVQKKLFFSLISGIYILSMPENVKNTTVFTREKEWFALDGLYPRESIDTSELDDIKEGTVILFPYYMDHYVKPLKDDVERITIAFNIMSSYDGFVNG